MTGDRRRSLFGIKKGMMGDIQTRCMQAMDQSIWNKNFFQSIQGNKISDANYTREGAEVLRMNMIEGVELE